MWNMMVRHSGRWSLMLLLLCTLTSGLTLQQPCPRQDYVSKEGICCNKCSPGFKLVEECHAPRERSNCTECPDRQYTDQMNYASNCRSCRSCKESDNKVTVSSCTKTRNTVCRCKVGFYKSVIDSETFQCLKCKICGPNETATPQCTSENDARCVCKENYYRVNNKCEPCNTCNDQCSHLCPKTTTYRPKDPNGTPEPPKDYLIIIIAAFVVSAIVLLFLVFVITYVTTKRSTKRKMTLSSEPRSISQDSHKVLIVNEEPWSDHNVQAVSQMPVSEQETFNLPDCVPLEINIPDLIYTVLDLVPVQQVKQLVRTLGVRDTDIEQAEADHRSCREAHYQMLRVWAERGSYAGRAGRGRIMYLPQLEELLDQLRKIHLGRAAEELETKYDIV